jgi:hypothetical protein
MDVKIVRDSFIVDGVGNRDDPLDSVTLGLITFLAVSTAGLVCLAIVWM